MRISFSKDPQTNLVHVRVSEPDDPPIFVDSHSFKLKIPSADDPSEAEILIYTNKVAASGDGQAADDRRVFDLERCFNQECRAKGHVKCGTTTGKGKRLMVANVFQTQPKQHALHLFGTALFKALFSGGAEQMLKQIKPSHPNGRIFLELNDDADLDAIPWEYAWDGQEFLVHKRKFARMINLPKPQPSRLPLRIVAVAPDPLIRPEDSKSSAEDLVDLHLADQFQEFINRLSKNNKEMILERAFPPTVHEMNLLLMQGDGMATVLHFMGHCAGTLTGERALIFENQDSNPDYVSTGTFNNLPKSLRLAFLSACDTRDFARYLVQQGPSYTIGSFCEIPDNYGRDFESRFYEFLAYGNTVEDTMQKTRASFKGSDIRGEYITGAMILYSATFREDDGTFDCKKGTLTVEDHLPTNNLVLMPTTPNFCGRKKELARVILALRHMTKACSVYTIEGIGGQGKTAMTVEAMNRIAHAFRGGIFVWQFSEDKPISAAEYLLEMAKTLLPQDALNNLYGGDLKKLEEAIYKKFINKASCLLILDHADSLKRAEARGDKAAQWLGNWLREVTSKSNIAVKILATSQGILGWPKEDVMHLGGLIGQDIGNGIDLFVRNLSVDIRARMDKDEKERSDGTIGKLLHNLVAYADGHPLSLELLGRAMSLPQHSNTSLEEFVCEDNCRIMLSEVSFKGQRLESSFGPMVDALPILQRLLLYVCSLLAGPITKEMLAFLSHFVDYTPTNTVRTDPSSNIENIAQNLQQLCDCGLLSKNAEEYRIQIALTETIRHRNTELKLRLQLPISDVYDDIFIIGSVKQSKQAVEKRVEYYSIGNTGCSVIDIPITNSRSLVMTAITEQAAFHRLAVFVCHTSEISHDGFPQFCSEQIIPIVNEADRDNAAMTKSNAVVNMKLPFILCLKPTNINLSKWSTKIAETVEILKTSLKETHWITRTNVSAGIVDFYHSTPITDATDTETMFLVSIKPTNQFVSRDNILEAIQAAIRGNQSRDVRMPVVLKGIGGMGKTELMLKYCYQYREKYSYVFWLHVDGRQATLDAFRGLATKLGIDVESDNSSNEDVLTNSIREWFESKTGWLLLLDNMDSSKDIDDYIPATGGDVIVTTRNHVSSQWATVIQVDKMSTEEALLLLLGPHPLFDKVKTANAKDIVHELDYFPLAVDMARSYIESTGISFIAYLRLIKRKPELLLADRSDTTPNKYKETVATVWNMTFKKIKEQSPLATRILGVLAFLQPDAIPTSLLQRQYDALALFAEQTSKSLDPVDDIRSAVGVLVEFSFVRRIPSDDIEQVDKPNSDDNSEPTNDILTIHRLVQTVVRNAMGSDECLQQCEHIVAALSREVVYVDSDDSQVRKANEMHLPQVRHIFELNNRSQMATEFQDLFVGLLGRTVQYLVNSGTLQDNEEFSKMAVSEIIRGPEHSDTAFALNSLAEVYKVQGKYDKAEALCQQALIICEKVLKLEDPRIATILNNLAWLYKTNGKYDMATPLYERALAILENVSEPEHMSLAIMSNLAELYVSMGKDDEAEPLLQRVLAISEKELGPEHPSIATTLSNLAGLYNIHGKYGEAELLYQRNLDICKKALGPEKPDTATALNNLARLYQNRGKYDEAEQLYQQALAIREEVLGPEHQDTATTLSSLAGLYKSQGKYDETELLYQRALKIFEKVLGLEHPSTATTLNNLAALYEKQGKYNEAKPLYERVLAVREKALGLEHLDTSTTLNNLAGLYKSQGKHDEAEPLYQRALEIRVVALKPEHPRIATSLNNLAGLYKDQGKYAEAELLYQQALAICEKGLGPEHPNIAKILNNLAGLYESQGKCEEAERLYQRALPISEKVLGQEHPSTATILNNLAVLYENQGKYDEAEPLYQRALVIHEKALGADNPTLETILNNKAGLCESRGKYDEAEPLYQRVLAIKEKVSGPEHPGTATILNNLAWLYRRLSKYDEAEGMYQRALEIFEKTLGPEHSNTTTTQSNLANLILIKGYPSS